MTRDLHLLDWLVIGSYLLGLLAFSAYLSRTQYSRADYYVGARNMGAWPIAISTMATQCSTNSILGAPAFVAFVAGGGLLWLQYELAVPLAMIAIMIFLLPIFRQLRLISVYQYLELRFGLATRLILSGLFQFIRAFATAVTVYSIAITIELITGLSFVWSVVLLGVVTVIYDTMGGVRGVIFSDLLQMGILVSILLVVFLFLLDETGGWARLFEALPANRQQTLDFSHHGLGDGHTFAFWPMLLGGFFLYISYYGCDQSQVQRELCARNLDVGNQALFLNGLLRFPVVLLYCLVGAGIAVYAAQSPAFIEALPQQNGSPNVNLAVPLYMVQQLPVGLVGLALVALFAAAMSSLDSVINSLSASTMEDFLHRFYSDRLSERAELLLSRLVTLAWGTVTLWFSFYVGGIADTVLEAINKVGSLINGPVLAVFALGLLTRRANSAGAVSGLLCGFGFNVYCWLWVPQLSWLWWNPFGFFASFTSGYLISLAASGKAPATNYCWTLKRYRQLDFNVNWYTYHWVLIAAFAGMFGLLMFIQTLG